jgi:hypothetical protein
VKLDGSYDVCEANIGNLCPGIHGLYAAPQHSADLDAMRLDAERYRWLRRRVFMADYSDDSVITIKMFRKEGPDGEFLDAAIDAALQAKGMTE